VGTREMEGKQTGCRQGLFYCSPISRLYSQPGGPSAKADERPPWSGTEGGPRGLERSVRVGRRVVTTRPAQMKGRANRTKCPAHQRPRRRRVLEGGVRPDDGSDCGGASRAGGAGRPESCRCPSGWSRCDRAKEVDGELPPRLDDPKVSARAPLVPISTSSSLWQRRRAVSACR
jgi:hypothetical protein